MVFKELSPEKLSWKEAQALARFLVEEASIKFSEIKSWLTQAAQDKATHDAWEELKSEWAGVNKKR